LNATVFVFDPGSACRTTQSNWLDVTWRPVLGHEAVVRPHVRCKRQAFSAALAAISGGSEHAASKAAAAERKPQSFETEFHHLAPGIFAAGVGVGAGVLRSTISSSPTKRLRTCILTIFLARSNTVVEDTGNNVAVTTNQSFGRAHLCTERQLTFSKAIAAILSISATLPFASGPPLQNVHLSILLREPKAPLLRNCGAPNRQQTSNNRNQCRYLCHEGQHPHRCGRSNLLDRQPYKGHLYSAYKQLKSIS